MNYWLHRISYEGKLSYPLLEDNYLSIGFWDFATEEFLKKSTEGDGEYFDNQFSVNDNGSLPRNRWSLWYFLYEMDKGDWVIVPGDGVFSIYEIEERSAILPSQIKFENLLDWNGNKVFQSDEGFFLDSNEEDIYIGFIRKVKPLYKNISRYEFADNALTKRLKTQSTTSNINDLEKNIKKALDLFKKKKPIDLKNMLIDLSINSWFEIIYNELNPEKFENLVCKYFLQNGCTEVYKPSKNESGKKGDVDVIATFEQLRTIINVQVKYYKGETNEWAIEQITEFADSKNILDDGFIRQYWVISSSDTFSETAINLAKENNVILINGKEFTRMLLLSGIQKIEEL